MPLYNIKTNFLKKKTKSMETLVTRELAKFTSILTAKCPAMAYKHYNSQPRRSSWMRIKQPIFYCAMDGSGYFTVDYFFSNNSLQWKKKKSQIFKVLVQTVQNPTVFVCDVILSRARSDGRAQNGAEPKHRGVDRSRGKHSSLGQNEDSDMQMNQI